MGRADGQGDKGAEHRLPSGYNAYNALHDHDATERRGAAVSEMRPKGRGMKAPSTGCCCQAGTLSHPIHTQAHLL